MVVPRLDMSRWIIHFVHRRNTENDPAWIVADGEYVRFPYVADEQKNERFGWWYYNDEKYPIEPDAYPIQVVWKIIDDGHIRGTWALRNNRPTVYMARAARCASPRCPSTRSSTMQNSGATRPTSRRTESPS